MGYQLAGFRSLGCLEIDKKMVEAYQKNLNPVHCYHEPIAEFNQRPDLPDELYSLDVLDGSPPCTVFSYAAALKGGRETQWQKKRKFHEGNAEQILDDLFFDFIKTVQKLKPKLVVAENVPGLTKGSARGYVKHIFQKLKAADYKVQMFLLDAAMMGVPQRRQRVFFIARRKDLNLPAFKLDFNQKLISFAEATKDLPPDNVENATERQKDLYDRISQGRGFKDIFGGNSFFNNTRIRPDNPIPTMTAHRDLYHPEIKRLLNTAELIRCQTFPDDYDFLKRHSWYFLGMSVPPKMMEGVAKELRAVLC